MVGTGGGCAFPLSVPHTIHWCNVDRVSAKIISPGDNIPITPETEQILLQKGISSLPDFVANCGGVLGANMELAGLRQGFIERFIDERIVAEVTALLQPAEKEGAILREYAEEVAENRSSRQKKRLKKEASLIRYFISPWACGERGSHPGTRPASFQGGILRKGWGEFCSQALLGH